MARQTTLRNYSRYRTRSFLRRAEAEARRRARSARTNRLRRVANAARELDTQRLNQYNRWSVDYGDGYRGAIARPHPYYIDNEGDVWSSRLRDRAPLSRLEFRRRFGNS